MKKSKIKSLKLNKQQVSKLGVDVSSIKGGASGGHDNCIPTYLRTNKTCVYVCNNNLTISLCNTRG
ncbi:hypothetical protein [Kordia sp.]|uniref:hypothetical protein n=1 Tax=Kordia sp. TaxID=1965332 RepID=UPI0025C63533|nr:hypothetical protein [Kordia sp.]MCH2195814.1 hypothetical protein [Kordia sp.]